MNTHNLFYGEVQILMPLFVGVEVLWPSQTNGVMSSVVSLLGRLSPLSG